MKLRDYQIRSVQEIFDHFHKGNKAVILYAQTGAGKSQIAAYLANDCLKHNFPCVMIVRGRELVKNLSNRLNKYSVPHSVYMAGSNRYDPGKLIQICSVDTLNSRSRFPYADQECLVILDEQHRNYDPIYESYKSAFFLGLSGTPFNTSQNKNYNEVVCPIMGFELRDSGYLVPEITYVPHLVDTSDIKIVAGDFKRDQLEQLMSESTVVGNIVDDYIKYGEMRPAICFAVSIEHSKRLMDSFNKRGIRAIHCDASSTEEERTYAKFALENNKIDVLVNVDIFSVGFDCPIVSCIILARPTWSLIWYLQAVGRGLRSAPGKKNCIVLDNAGNIFRHGGPYKIREVDLYADPKARARRVLDESVKNCSNCFIIMLSVDLKCSHCGHVQEIKKKKLKEKSGELIIFNESPIEAKERKKRECKLHYQKLEWVRKQKKFHENWTFNNLEKKFDKETIWSLNSVARVPDRFSPKQGNVSSAFVENLRLV